MNHKLRSESQWTIITISLGLHITGVRKNKNHGGLPDVPSHQQRIVLSMEKRLGAFWFARLSCALTCGKQKNWPTKQETNDHTQTSQPINMGVQTQPWKTSSAEQQRFSFTDPKTSGMAKSLPTGRRAKGPARLRDDLRKRFYASDCDNDCPQIG